MLFGSVAFRSAKGRAFAERKTTRSAGRAKLLLSRETEDTLTRSCGSAGASPSRSGSELKLGPTGPPIAGGLVDANSSALMIRPFDSSLRLNFKSPT